MLKNYALLCEKIKDYDQTAEKMCEKYYELFCDLVREKDEIGRGKRVSCFNFILTNELLKSALRFKEKITHMRIGRKI